MTNRNWQFSVTVLKLEFRRARLRRRGTPGLGAVPPQTAWQEVQQRALAQDLGWDTAAAQYADLYRDMLR